jgi:hypothetical protein
MSIIASRVLAAGLVATLAACAPCASYHYSTCPDRCARRCASSGCATDVSGETICTSDCDGPQSCVEPGESAPSG